MSGGGGVCPVTILYIFYVYVTLRTDAMIQYLLIE